MPRIVLILLVVVSISLPISITGCGSSKKTTAKKDYGKPVWLKVDESKLSRLSEDATNLENGTITVYDPEGWERLSRGAAKPPKGFKSVIVFKKNGATIMMTKSEEARNLPDLDEENIEEFADGTQQKFKASVKMVKLNNKVGVYFSRRVADAQRLSKYYDRRIVATTINGGLFTYELIADQGKINESLLNTLFAVISKTQFENSGTDESGTDKEVADKVADKGATDKVAADKVADKGATDKEVATDKVAANKVADKGATDEIVKGTAKEDTALVADIVPKPVAPETKSENKPESKQQSEEVAVSKPVLEKPETSPELAVKSSSPEKKPDTKKPDTKKTATKKPAKKGNTKDILNELDALLN
ncbi:MAG: hypothetical protein LBC20_13375 [Planctomycetaceae bacterium]|jgi:hypothetical protein|nr:hypothetical protein [Planctomycetaceae bacterium]